MPLLVLVKEASSEIVLKLLETKLVNFKDFFVKHFSMREVLFSLVDRFQLRDEGDITPEFVRKSVENSGLFLESKIHRGKFEGLKSDVKAKLLSQLLKSSGKESFTLSRALNLLEAYAISNLLSKNFFLIPLFLPLPPFKSAELFINKEELKEFKRKGFLSVVIVLDLERYGKLKVSLLFDSAERSFDVNFTSESEELLEKLRRSQEEIVKFLSGKFKLRITYTNRAPELPEVEFENIPVEVDLTV